MKIQYYISLLMLLTISLLLFLACSHDDERQQAVLQEKNVTLEVKIPGVKMPYASRMTIVQENNVKQLTVLAYMTVGGSERLVQKIVVDASGITDLGNGNLLIKLAIDQGNYNRLVLIANANVQAGLLAIDSDLSALRDLEYTHPTGEWDATTPDYIPMSGELVAATVNGFEIRQNVGRTFDNLQLIRMLARVDVYNKVYDSFTLKEVGLYNIMRNGRIVADLSKYNADPPAPHLPSIPQVITSPVMYDYSALQSGNVMSSRIYLFEANGADATTMGSSPRIVLKGTYGSEDYYYPVDFAYSTTAGSVNRGDFMPVVRNHQYIFSITKVTGEGFSSAAEALESTASCTNIELQMLMIDDDFMDVYYSATNFLAVNTTGTEIRMEFNAYDSATDDNTITVLTNAESFTIECYDYATGELAESTLMRPDCNSYSGGSRVDAFLIADYISIPTTPGFDGYVIVKAGDLQSERIPVYKCRCGENGTEVTRLIGNNMYKTHLYPTGTNHELECWMVENSKEGVSSATMYGNDPEKVNGYYYTWVQAAIYNNACPKGWSLPDNSQWSYLIYDVYYANDISNRWWGGSLGASNNAFAGYGNANGANWSDWNMLSYWWQFTEINHCYSFDDKFYVTQHKLANNNFASVRCVKDQPHLIQESL